MAHTSTWLGSGRWAKMQLTQSYSFERSPMDTNLFTDRSIWTMLHGIVLGGGALLGLSAALFALVTMRPPRVEDAAPERQGRDIGWLTTFVAITLWLTVIVGTYVSFPPYRATPPEGLTDLTRYPRSFLLANPDTAWLHSFAMEIKEHVPWIAAMSSTAVAFVCVRHPSRLLHDAAVRRIAVTLLATCFVLVAVVSLLGVFINKVAPLD
jgi:heme A synthase